MTDRVTSLPNDLLHHLTNTQYLDDVEVCSFAQTNHHILAVISQRYERRKRVEWYFYPVAELVSDHFRLRLPWLNTADEVNYVFEQQHHPSLPSAIESSPPRTEEPVKFVLLCQEPEKATDLDPHPELPSSAFILNRSYVSRPYAIGHASRIYLRPPTIPCPHPEEKKKPATVPRPYLSHFNFLPPTTTYLSFHDVTFIDSPEAIPDYIWPKKLTSLSVDCLNPHLFSEAMVSRMPPSLTYLYLSSKSSISNSTNLILPPTLLQLLLVKNVDPTSLKLPHSLTQLSCSPRLPLCQFDLESCGTTLRKLIFGYDFNKSVDKCIVPTNLTELKMGAAFNLPIDGMIFNDQLTTLEFPGPFNHDLRGVSFPPSLANLMFCSYQQTLVDVKDLSHLRTLLFLYDFNPTVLDPQFTFSTSLTHLNLGALSGDNIRLIRLGDTAPKVVLPQVWTHLFTLTELKQLHIPYHLLLRTALPPMTVIQELTITHHHDYSYSSSTTDQQDMARLTELLARCRKLQRFTFNFDEKSSIQLGGLIFPSVELQEIDFISPTNRPLNGVTFGETVKKLSFGYSFNQPLVGVSFPHSLRVMQFDSLHFNHPLDEVVWPTGLEVLRFSVGFNQPLQQVKFPQLKVLNLGITYNKSLTGVTLPRTLTYFGFGTSRGSSAFTHTDSLVQLDWPFDSLQTLILPHPRSPQLPQQSPSLGRPSGYSAWLSNLNQTHPYLRVRFNLLFDD